MFGFTRISSTSYWNGMSWFSISRPAVWSVCAFGP